MSIDPYGRWCRPQTKKVLNKFDYISLSVLPVARHSISQVENSGDFELSLSQLLTALRHSVSPGRPQILLTGIFLQQTVLKYMVPPGFAVN